MASTSFIDGSLLRVTISDAGGSSFSTLFHAQQGSISMTRNTSEIITKDVGGGQSWRQVTGRMKSATITANGLVFYNTSAGQINTKELFDYFDGDAKVDWQWTTGVQGDPVYSGMGVVTNFSESAASDEEATWDLTIEVDGAITKGDVP